jgi:hypothetical protein
MRVFDIYAVIEKVDGGWKGISLADTGNLYVDEVFPTEDKARNAVLQEVKSLLNQIDHGDMVNWYRIVETTRDSVEFTKAWGFYLECEENPPEKSIIFKIQCLWLIVGIYKGWVMEWVRYFKGLVTRSN